MTLQQRIEALAQAIGLDVKALQERTVIVQITQAAYDALPEKDPNTLYVIVG